MKRIIILTICIILIIFSTGCKDKSVIEENNQNNLKIEELEKTNNELEEKIDTYQNNLSSIKEEKDFYLDFISQIVTQMPEEEQIELAKTQWQYHLLLNNTPIPVDGIINMDKDEFELTVIEEQNLYTALPDELHSKGRISGSIFSNHIKFLNIKPNGTTGADGTIVSSTTYSFEHLSLGSVINLELSGELQQRLNLNTNVLTITIIDPSSESNDESN